MTSAEKHRLRLHWSMLSSVLVVFRSCCCAARHCEVLAGHPAVSLGSLGCGSSSHCMSLWRCSLYRKGSPLQGVSACLPIYMYKWKHMYIYTLDYAAFKICSLTFIHIFYLSESTEIPSYVTKCPSNGLCSRLPPDCVTCNTNYSCTYGKPAAFDCRVKPHVHCVVSNLCLWNPNSSRLLKLWHLVIGEKELTSSFSQGQVCGSVLHLATAYSGVRVKRRICPFPFCLSGVGPFWDAAMQINLLNNENWTVWKWGG